MPALELGEVDTLIAAQKGVALEDSTILFRGLGMGVKGFHRGKVRDSYDLGDHLLMVATDRISIYDVVLPTPIPGKGVILDQTSEMWFDRYRDMMPNHFVTSNVDDYPAPFRGVDDLRGRSMLVQKLQKIPYECIARGYISGSLWAEYKKGSLEILGHTFPPDLTESQKLPSSIFTPSTKEEQGHDINISYEELEDAIGMPIATKLDEASLELYDDAVEYAYPRGIILADTKFEFAFPVKDGEDIILIDEALTSDSSRFWPVESYNPGGPQISFDKQYVRDYGDSLKWDHTYPGPELPVDVVAKTQEKYREAFRRLTGNAA